VAVGHRTTWGKPGGPSCTITPMRSHACDVLSVTDLWFRFLFAFFLIELGSRKVVRVGVTRHPTDEWIAQQLREATPCGTRPCYLIRDNDSKDGPQMARVAATSQIELRKTPVRAPQANASCERFLGSVRRECRDHVLVLHGRHLGRVLREYVEYFNRARPTREWTKRSQADPRCGPVARRATRPSSPGPSWEVSTTTIASLHDTPNAAPF
jgi:putative transposase